MDRSLEALSVLEDILQHDDDWTDIPDTIRMSLKAAHAIFKSFTSILRQQEETVEKKADKEEIKKAFKLKANIVDVEDSMDKVQDAIDSKVSIDEMESILADFARKTDLNQPQSTADFKPLVDRLDRLEKFALSLQVDEGAHQQSASKGELDVIYSMLGECVRVGELDQLKKVVIFHDQIDAILEKRYLPSVVSRQILPLQSSVNSLSAVVSDLGEQLAAISPFNKFAASELERLSSAFRSHEADLKSLNSVISTVTSSSKQIQQELDAIMQQLSSLNTRPPPRALGSEDRSAALDTRLKLLEANEKRTQEVLEILSKHKLDPPAPPQPVIKQSGPDHLEDLKEYIDKRVKKVESAAAKKMEVDSRIDELEKTNNKIFDTLKDTIKDLNKKLKGLAADIDDRIDRRVGSLRPKSKEKKPMPKKTDSTVAVEGDGPLPHLDKLRKIDQLLLKVSAMIEEKKEDDQRGLLEARLKTLEEKLEEKADKQKVCKLLDRKAEIEDINKALINIHEELDRRPPAEKDASGLADPGDGQTHRPVSIFPMHAVWIWRTNSLSQGLVVWDSETVNSDPSSIVWDRSRSGVLLVQGGLYEFSFGYFGLNKPHVELLLNNEPILSSRSQKPQDKVYGQFEHMHNLGNITGLTCIDYFIMPPRAKISFVVKGSSQYEGFLFIKKI